ncbi:MAG: ABC transporter substrate-binding protein [Bacillota bacterium]
MRKVISVLLLVCIMLSVSACGGQTTVVRPGETHELKSDDLRADNRAELVAVTDVALPELKKIVSRFNAQSEDYYVRLIEYSGTDKSMELLRTEILAGKAPDIYAFYSYSSLSEVEPKNNFEDLLPYLDADSEYGRETLVPGLFNALSEGGQLYWLPYDYSIETFVAHESMVGSKAKLTMEDLDAIAAAQRPALHVFPEWMAQDLLLYYVSTFSIDRFVDSQAGTCDFDNPDFLRLLKKCSLQPEKSVPDDHDTGVLTSYSLQCLEQIAILSTNYGADFRFVGFPDEESNGSMFSVNLRLGVSTQSKNKDGAWAFVRSILNTENQVEATFLPATQAEFDARLTQAINGDYNAPHFGPVKIEQADIDKLAALIDETRVLSGHNAVLRQIIQEECLAYFAGDKSVEETARVIQSRASLYISEHS